MAGFQSQELVYNQGLGKTFPTCCRAAVFPSVPLPVTTEVQVLHLQTKHVPGT